MPIDVPVGDTPVDGGVHELPERPEGGELELRVTRSGVADAGPVLDRPLDDPVDVADEPAASRTRGVAYPPDPLLEDGGHLGGGVTGRRRHLHQRLDELAVDPLAGRRDPLGGCECAVAVDQTALDLDADAHGSRAPGRSRTGVLPSSPASVVIVRQNPFVATGDRDGGWFRSVCGMKLMATPDASSPCDPTPSETAS